MMKRRTRRGRDEVKMGFFVPKRIAKAIRLRALQDEVPIRTVFLRALTAYLRTNRKKEET